MRGALAQVPMFCFAGHGGDGKVDVKAISHGGSGSRQHEVLFGALSQLEQVCGQLVVGCARS
jgi:hypothetical protein